MSWFCNHWNRQGILSPNNKAMEEIGISVCNFCASCVEGQKRTAEYPPALRGALQRNDSRDTRKYGGSSWNLRGIAGRSNDE